MCYNTLSFFQLNYIFSCQISQSYLSFIRLHVHVNTTPRERKTPAAAAAAATQPPQKQIKYHIRPVALHVNDKHMFISSYIVFGVCTMYVYTWVSSGVAPAHVE